MASDRHGRVVSDGGEALWFLGTLTRIKLDARNTGGRFGLFEVLLPHGAAPPLHAHPQDETLYVLEGQVTGWLVDAETAATAGEGADGVPPAWVADDAQRCGPGDVIFAPGGTPHTFRVESDTARLLTISTPAGIEEYARALAEPAAYPWLPPPPDGLRVTPEQMEQANAAHGFVRHGPPPPPPGS